MAGRRPARQESLVDLADAGDQITLDAEDAAVGQERHLAPEGGSKDGFDGAAARAGAKWLLEGEAVTPSRFDVEGADLVADCTHRATLGRPGAHVEPELAFADRSHPSGG